MNDNLNSPCGSEEFGLQQANSVSLRQSGSRFFQSVDWLSFGLTTAIALAIYLFTLAPDVTLESQGIFVTGAFYAGVSRPPGYPLWTLYAWLFTVLLPVSNVSWRVAVSSAIAGALTCGLLALMVSRIGKALLEDGTILTNLPPKQEKWLRIAAGYAAGMAFGFSNPFWFLAVVGDVWPLSILLLACVLCLLLRWFHDPARRRYLVVACFVYGLTLTNSQALVPAAPGLAMMVVLRNTAVGRDGLFSVALLLSIMGIFGLAPSIFAKDGQAQQLAWYGGITAFLLASGLVMKTSRLFTEWKTVLASGIAILLGLSLYFYLPIASMTNPPVNWGYPRTVTGFVHVLTRGQFERIHPAESVVGLAKGMGSYSKSMLTDFGWIFLPPALLPFLLFRKMKDSARRLMLGTLAVFISLSLLMVYFLNPAPDRSALGMYAGYFSASYLLVSLWMGWGMVLAGAIWGQWRDDRAEADGPHSFKN